MGPIPMPTMLWRAARPHLVAPVHTQASSCSFSLSLRPALRRAACCVSWPVGYSLLLGRPYFPCPYLLRPGFAPNPARQCCTLRTTEPCLALPCPCLGPFGISQPPPLSFDTSSILKLTRNFFAIALILSILTVLSPFPYPPSSPLPLLYPYPTLCCQHVVPGCQDPRRP